MHHHPTTSGIVGSMAPAGSSTTQQQQPTQQQRRRKKRPNYGTRTVEVKRGYNLDFGFTISGQQPCRLSCIVSNSPAEQAGLRPGDFLISVNGLNVSKLPHETVVQLIGNSFGSIRMQIAENYFSDSSDEENAVAAASLLQTNNGSPLARGLNGSLCGATRTRPRFLHHRAKMHRLRNSPQKKRQQSLPRTQNSTRATNKISAPIEPSSTSSALRPLIEDLPLQSSTIHIGNQSVSAPLQVGNCTAAASSVTSADVANVSAMVRVVPSVALEYRAVVGYLGTIEMPKQISHSSKLQTVRSCIRKLRQEKRQPTTVLMTILPDCLRLQAANGNVLATYASARLNYVSSSSESENRFFGLVTSAVHTLQPDDDDDDDNGQVNDNQLDNQAMRLGNIEQAMKATNVISISNSCHVFVVDTKLCDHQIHTPRATEFHIQCTRDPISSLCLEFPRHAEYVVNLIRSMYTMRILPPATRQASADAAASSLAHQQGVCGAVAAAAAHSPQPSNHSEISTTTSNSDSGIGFHNDCANISDRILVVDFPGAPELRNRLPPQPPVVGTRRPLGIFNNFDPSCDNRLTVRAMPDPKALATLSPPPRPPPNLMHGRSSGRPDLLANFNLIKSPGACNLSATRSCDDVLGLVERSPADGDENDDYFVATSHASMDDLALAPNTERYNDENFFLPPTSLPPYKRYVSNHSNSTNPSETYALLEDYRTGVARNTRRSLETQKTPHKLSPQVYVTSKTVIETSPSKPMRDRNSVGLPSIGLPAMSSASTTDLLNTQCKSADAVSSSTLFDFDIDTWSSLQNLHARVQYEYKNHISRTLEATNSEPDLGNRALPSNASPFRRAWVQSSFRTPRSDKHSQSPQQQQQQRGASGGGSGGIASPLVRRAASMTASDNDVYIKSMNGYVDELKQAQLKKFGINNNNNNNNHGVTNSGGSGGCGAGVSTVNFKTPAISGASATNLAASSSQKDSTANEEENKPLGVAAWSSSFERLLEDAAGLHTFAEFLKKEFSAENIYFWTACERYRQTEEPADRVTQARAIFNKHLANGSLEPVNVDSQARNLSEEKLQSAELNIFALAQKQIFHLMKFDSYQRFIRSDLYKSCQEAEQKQQPLPYRAEDLDELLRLSIHQNGASAGAASKLKKSASNAEDRRRKSLLPWHRKTRSKSRDRSEPETNKSTSNITAGPATTTTTISTSTHQLQTPCKLPQLSSSSSLKIPSSHNSLSDIHSSRSSLSSFDAVTANVAQNHATEVACSLCRVILSDGATTIVQTRADETVGQLVERLLEKRGLSYKYYDVVANGGSSKSIDLQANALATLAGKEVLIEQRVAFKLDLPDPKVISVKSKPKKVLHEVIRPILHKYNYDMEAVQVYVRDTQSLLDLSLPVTTVDGQRLQIVLLRHSGEVKVGLPDYQNGNGCTKFPRPAPLLKSCSTTTMIPTPFTKSNCIAARNALPQSTLDEITNKVFNELLQGKGEPVNLNEKQQQSQLPRISDMCSIKSDDGASETSSIFERIRRRDSGNVPAPRSRLKKKSIGSQHSEETSTCQALTTPTTLAPPTPTNVDVKKPIIAKLKAGAKLQVTERVNENPDELLEGLKRAQLARLEDQRGTEINFELPDFLKHKENISAAASKLRKVRANLSPISNKLQESSIISSSSTKITSISPTLYSSSTSTTLSSPTKATDILPPQPAPRLSITNRSKTNSVSPMKIDDEEPLNTTNSLSSTSNIDGNNHSNNDSTGSEQTNEDHSKGPPPLPPKPKVLPIKPSNWGAGSSVNSNGNSFNATKIPIDVNRKLSANGEQIASSLTTATTRNAYLEEPTSAFV